MLITASIVSHQHGSMVWKLVDQLLESPLIARIIVTLNVLELVPAEYSNKVTLIQNKVPKGYGANHNQAFLNCYTDFFCVLNPDIRLSEDPFLQLTSAFSDKSISLVTPQIQNPFGLIEDNAREFLTLTSLFKRYLSFPLTKSFGMTEKIVFPDWVAGMFMLFKSSDYLALRGFDESYFMYCEDADICTRIWLSGKKVALLTSVKAIHDARRASHYSFQHLYWHARSLFRYMLASRGCEVRKDI